MSEHNLDPYSRPANAERAVLGAMMLSAHAIDEVADTLTGRDYASPKHEVIHDAILALRYGDSRVDTISVGDELARTHALASVGGQAYLHELVEGVPSAANADYYARIVRNASMLRQVGQVSTRLGQLAETDGADTDVVLDVVNTARGELDQLTTTQDAAPSNVDSLYAAIDELDGTPGQPTPWEPLTATIAGWKPGCLYLIGARPGIGKSVAGVDIALDTARRGDAALIYSLEMSRTELYHRLLAHIGSIDMGRIQRRHLTSEDWKAVAVAGERIAALPLHVDDRAALSLAQIRSSIRTQQRKHPVGIVVVDYLQLVTPPPGTPRDDRRVQVDAISRGLKNLAKDCHLPIVALTQLNRSSEQRADKTPTLSDLREAGGQEQDADVVILMHRAITGDDPNLLRLLVAKNRHGNQSQLELRFEGCYSRIQEPAWSPHSTLNRNAS